jgi:hypothetical protein
VGLGAAASKAGLSMAEHNTIERKKSLNMNRSSSSEAATRLTLIREKKKTISSNFLADDF